MEITIKLKLFSGAITAVLYSKDCTEADLHACEYYNVNDENITDVLTDLEKSCLFLIVRYEFKNWVTANKNMVNT